jgi:Flagellin and related hook-associated proteins
MGMLTNIYTTALNLGNIYAQNNALLSQSLERLATGKKINTPADDLGGYTHAMDLKTSYDVYGSINQNLQDWKGAMDVASTAAGSINSSLQRMQELIDLSQNASTNAEKDADQTEFMQLAASIQTTRNSTNANGAYVLNSSASLASIPLVPGSAAPTLDINFTAAAIGDTNLANLNDPTKIKIGHTAPDYAGTQSYLDAVTADMATYNAKVEGFSKQIDTFTNINNTIITNQKSAASSITDINEADELAQYNMLNIRQQGSVAMLAQANLSAQNMLMLYGFKNA